MASSVFSVDMDKEAIKKSIKKAISGKSVIKYNNLFYSAGNTSEKIVKKIEERFCK